MHATLGAASPARLCRLLIALRILVVIIFQTFHISWLSLFTVPWDCPVIGKHVSNKMTYFPTRGGPGKC